MAEADARARIAVQLPARLKRERVDLVLENDGDLATLATRTAAAWQRLADWAAVAHESEGSDHSRRSPST
jgi:dephospho-CoA kinase